MILALALFVTLPSDSLTRLFSLGARIGPGIPFAGDGGFHDEYLGNIDMPFAGIESALFSIDEGSGRYERAALFEFDARERLVHQVHYVFDVVFSEETRQFVDGRLVSWTNSAHDSTSESRVEVHEFAYDDAGRLIRACSSVDRVEQSRAEYCYSPDGQVIERTTQYVQGGRPKVTTTRIQSDLFGRVTREWRQEEGDPEELVRRNEYDEQGRIATAAFVNAGELFTHTITYSEAANAWRTRSISGSDGRFLSLETSFLSASGKLARGEYLVCSGVVQNSSLLDGSYTLVWEHRYDEQGCLVRSLHRKSPHEEIEVSLRSLERDGQGTVIGWQDFQSSGTPRVMRPVRRVHIDLKYRTAPR